MGVATRNLINICDDFAKDFKGVLMDVKSQSEARVESGHIELMKIDTHLQHIDFARKIEALKEAMTKSVSSKASGIISRSFCQPAISYGINALGDQVERAITKSTETFRDRAVRIHEDQRKEYAIEVVVGDKQDEKLSKAKPDSYDKKVLSGAKDDVLDESKPGDITSLAGISESNKKKIEIYDESGKIIKVVGGSYKGEAIRLKYMKGDELGHYELIKESSLRGAFSDKAIQENKRFDCLYKACSEALGKSSIDLRRDIVSSMDRNPGAFSQMIFARNYLASTPLGKGSLMQRWVYGVLEKFFLYRTLQFP